MKERYVCDQKLRHHRDAKAAKHESSQLLIAT